VNLKLKRSYKPNKPKVEENPPGIMPYAFREMINLEEPIIIKADEKPEKVKKTKKI
jgi:hypothetical protein